MKAIASVLVSAAFAAVAAQLTGCVAAVGAGAAGGAAAAYDRRTTGTLVDDELIEWKAMNALGKDSEISGQGHINVISYNNLVLISGEVPTAPLKQRAGELVRALPKVRGIFNELAIAAPSSMLARSSDTVVTGKVKSALLAAQAVEGARIKVVTEGGVVFLMGLVKRAEAEHATELSRRVGGVQRVVRLFEYLD